MKHICFLWASIILGNYVQAENVYFQLLDKNLTGDELIEYTIIKFGNNSSSGEKISNSQIAQQPSKDNFNITEETLYFKEYDLGSIWIAIENVTLKDASDITVPNFKEEYEPNSTWRLYENDIFKRIPDDDFKFPANFPDIPKDFNYPKIDEIPYFHENYKPIRIIRYDNTRTLSLWTFRLYCWMSTGLLV